MQEFLPLLTHAARQTQPASTYTRQGGWKSELPHSRDCGPRVLTETWENNRSSQKYAPCSHSYPQPGLFLVFETALCDNHSVSIYTI